MRKSVLFLVISAVLLVRPAPAQTTVSYQKFGGYDGSPDVIDLGTLGLHLEIPLFTKQGRGLGTSIRFELVNSSGPQTCNTSPSGSGCLGYGPGISSGTSVSWWVRQLTSRVCLHDQALYTNTYSFQFTDEHGNAHNFPGTTEVTDCYNNINYNHYESSLSEQASDGSGYYLQVTGWSGTVTDPSGSSYQVGPWTNSAYWVDANGNNVNLYYSNNYGDISSSNLKDTLGSVISVSGGQYISGNPNYRQPEIITWLDDVGNSQNITLTYKNYTLSPYEVVWNAGPPPCTGATTYANTGLADAITFPDGSAYHFTYEASYCVAGAVTGRLASITLPSGGIISYTYPGGRTVQCGDNGPLSLTRTTSDGTTAYTRTILSTSNCSPTTSSTKIVKPNGDQTLAYFAQPQENFQGVTVPDSGKTFETSRYEYSASNLNTPIRSTTRCYNGATGNCTLVLPYEPVTQLAVTTTLDTGISSKVVTQYNASSLPTEIDEYDFGATSPTRKTLTTYQTFNTLLSDRPSSVIVYDASGNLAKKTTYTYDEVVPPPMTLPGHTTLSTPRRDLTSMYEWISSTGTARTTNFTYDDAGQVTAVKDPNTNTTYYAYDTATDAYRTKITRPPTGTTTHISTFAYGPNSGLLTSAYDENNQLTSYTYDSMFRPSSITYPDGGQTAFSYTPTSKTTNRLIQTGVWATNVVQTDGYGRTTQAKLTSDPQGTTFTDTTYDNLGRVHTMSNPYRSTSDSTYGVTTYTYDALGRPCVVTSPDATPPSGSSCPTSQPANSGFSVYSGNTVTATDQAGKSRKSVSDGLGRLTQVFEDPAGLNYETDYTYDALDNLLTVNQKGGSTNSANWRTRTFNYDLLSHLLCASNPESSSAACPAIATSSYTVGTTGYTYDSNGNMLTKTALAPNQTGTATVITTYAYDVLNRLTQRSYNDSGLTPTVQYGYDAVALTGCATTPPTLTDNYPKPRRTAMCDGAGAESWSHDVTGRVLTDPRTTNGVTKSTVYTYLPYLDGSANSITYPSGRTLTYSTNAAERLVSLQDNSTSVYYASSALYGPQGALTSLTNGPNLYSTYIYDKRLQPCWLYTTTTTALATSTLCTATAVTGNILDFKYNFNLGASDNGNVAGVTNNRDTTRSQTASYDSLNRIAIAETTSTQATSPSNCWGEAYFYDNLTTAGGAWGNLTAINSPSSAYTGCTGESLSLTALTNNRLSGFGYDAPGNLNSGSGVSGISYNAENQLVTAAGVTYKYDGDGNRVYKSGGTLYWYGTSSAPLDETDLSGNLASEYVFFGGERIARRDPSNNVFYYFTDHLGTSRTMAEVASGQSTATLCYDADFYPFGVERTPVINTCSQNYKFTGKERDSESGLDNFGARFDASSLGRFMSPDPGNAGATLDAPQSWNAYSYVLNNPLKYVDPFGLDCIYTNQDGTFNHLNGGDGTNPDCGKNADGTEDNGYYVDGTVNRSSIAFTGGDNNTMFYSFTSEDTPGPLVGHNCIGDCSTPDATARVFSSSDPNIPTMSAAPYPSLFPPPFRITYKSPTTIGGKLGLAVGCYTGLDSSLVGSSPETPAGTDHFEQTPSDEKYNEGTAVKVPKGDPTNTGNTGKRPGPAPRYNQGGSERASQGGKMGEAFAYADNASACSQRGLGLAP